MAIFSKEILDSMTPKGSKIPVGIHTKVNISSVDIGENYVDFNYQDSSGRKANKRVWFPDMAKSTARDGKTIQEVFADSEKRAVIDILEHLKVFATDDQITTSFAEFASVKDAAVRIKAAIDSKLGNETINLKMVPDKTGKYSEVARFGFIEKHIAGKDPEIYFSNYEKEQIAKSSGGSASSDYSSAPSDSNLGDLI